eukprot:2422553-Prymnesium_polylepis.1
MMQVQTAPCSGHVAAAESPLYKQLRLPEVYTEASGKRKVDGELAATRLGSVASERWANERFRQTFLLVREFRMEWCRVTGRRRLDSSCNST